MKAGKYRFGAFAASRGECRICKERRTGVLIRLKVPSKKELRICHECLIEHLLSYDPIIKEAKKATERIKKHREKLEKLKKEPKHKLSIEKFSSLSRIERKGNGLLPEVLVDAETQEAPPAKTNGQNRDSGGGIESHRWETTGKTETR